MSILAKAECAPRLPRVRGNERLKFAQAAGLLRVVAVACLCVAGAATGSSADAPFEEPVSEREAYAAFGAVSLWRDVDHGPQRTIDLQIVPAEFAQPEPDEPLPQPRTFDADDPTRREPSFLEGQDPPRRRPAFLDSDDSTLTVSQELQRLNQRIDELEAAKRAHEDATRTIIRQSFAEKGSNINDYVVFGGTLETLTFWFEDFDDVAESDIVLDTAELDFEITVNNWTVGSLVVEYFDGTDFLFPTTEDDEIGVDRITVRQAIITIGDTTRYPMFSTFGRAVVPFGISTGDPVADVLTIVDPLTVEVFETHEDFILIGFEWPPTGQPPPLSPGAAPAPLPPQPLLINPLVRRTARRMCEYCGLPPAAPVRPAAVPPMCVSPLSGAIYFYNGNTVEGPDEEDHIEHMGGTLGWRTKGLTRRRGIPWSIDVDCDVNSSVFDSDFLQFEYRRFLDQIGFVPGMASHIKANYGPVALVAEWNGALTDAEFVDDTGALFEIRPRAWQIALAYQFDWNSAVEIIGAQGTYFTIGYSESDDLFGVTRLIGGDPIAVPPVPATPTRVGFVPERRLSVGLGEWVLPGLRVAFEYSYALDYDEEDGGTGESAHGFFNQITYEW
jgi:hypothetical protein